MHSITAFYPAVAEAELVREYLTFAKVDVYNCDTMSKLKLGATKVSGFTDHDLATLNRLSADQLAQHRWGHAQMVHESFADYLAVWNAGAGRTDPPNLTIARFKRTGTYALTVGGLVVTTAASLSNVLPPSTDREVQGSLVLA